MIGVEKVWASLIANQDFVAEFPAGERRDLFRSMIVEPTLTLLADHFDKPVTLATLAAAKLVIARHAADTDFAVKTVELQLQESGEQVDEKTLKESIAANRAAVAVLVLKMQLAIAKIAAMSDGNTPVGPGTRPTSALVQTLKRGGVDLNAPPKTIGELLETHPVAIYL